ncbi:hypothetical protein KP509_10G001500 [Ceratopteris richardii]|uniref:Tify domain-containing protein n=1 Tax=Ceratopteris richardii TaxID=49495 RepID=A0A8T2TVV7_CERRI|nr:hypothetical protein KP509_10G001500 [Ceratopteris richardii]
MAHVLSTNLTLGPSETHVGDRPEPHAGLENYDGAHGQEDDTWTQGAMRESYQTKLIDGHGALSAFPESSSSGCVRVDKADFSQRICTQLTLFYAGTVNVYENVTPDKAQMIISLAEGDTSPLEAMDLIGSYSLCPSVPCMMDVNITSETRVPRLLDVDVRGKFSAICENIEFPEERREHELPAFFVPLEAEVPKVLPFARKASLTRFLERRRERCVYFIIKSLAK